MDGGRTLREGGERGGRVAWQDGGGRRGGVRWEVGGGPARGGGVRYRWVMGSSQKVGGGGGGGGGRLTRGTKLLCTS